jgi:hypothetical protein
MLWRELDGAVAQAKDRFPPTSLLFIQLGSNDLTEIKSVDLVNNITSAILRIELLFTNAKVVRSETLMRRYWHNALELEFLSAQYTMEDPKNHMVFEPRLLLWDGGFPLELLWGFKRVLLVVPID